MGKQIYFSDIEQSAVVEGLRILLMEHDYVLSAEPKDSCLKVCAVFSKEEKLTVTKHGTDCEIRYHEKAHFFRGVTLLLQNQNQQDFISGETPNFHSNGIMLDCSRNCVPTMDTIKKYVVRLAKFGMNRLYLYMEDTLELTEYPYWGSLRGRYSKEEIRECDRYASLFGVTLVPCIQTLAHLRSVLKQPAFSNYQDIDDILIPEDSDTRQLLHTLLQTVADCFSGGIVHLGMDEAAHLGRGRYMDRYGYQNPAGIMKQHLDWLMQECAQLGLTPMIWSDMYLTLNFETEDYYGIPADAEPAGTENLSRNVTLCYWDYYNEGSDFYEDYIALHKKLGNPLVFAGGAWTWNGVAPAISKAFSTTWDALNACCDTGIEDVFCTVWMDNGAETPLITCLPVLALYGEFGFSRTPSCRQVSERFRFCFGKNWENYCLLDAFDNLTYQPEEINPVFHTANHNRNCENPSKAILYEDCMMGRMSVMLCEPKLRQHYAWLSKKLQMITERPETMDKEDRALFEYYATLAFLLSEKADLTEQIRQAYRTGDNSALFRLSKEECGKIADFAEALRIQRQNLWMKEYKPFGYEILDIRLGGVAVRAKSAAERIAGYLAGKTDRLAELEEDILPYKTPEMLEHERLHGVYLWEELISAGNMDGV